MTDNDGRGEGVEIKRTYSLVDISERLGRPRTTLADWARQFREFLPTVGSGRTMRYNEAALEVFGLISKMKEANEPPEYIKEQLRGVVTEIIVPMTDEDEGKPYLMQLAGEIVKLQNAVVMLAEQNDGLRRELDEVRREAAAGTEQLSGRISDVSDSLGNEIRKGQEQTNEKIDQMGEQILSRMETHRKQKRGLLGRLFGK
jgi:predicted  nucleic acid-binding Zn-ribbon protein